jgi:hypothetical protein
MDYNKLEGKIYGERLGNQSEYWYITAEWIPKDGLGKPKPKRSVLLGPYSSESIANDTGMQRLGNISFEVIPLRTRDRGKATQQLRAMKLNSGQDLDSALQRVSHK